MAPPHCSRAKAHFVLLLPLCSPVLPRALFLLPRAPGAPPVLLLKEPCSLSRSNKVTATLISGYLVSRTWNNTWPFIYCRFARALSRLLRYGDILEYPREELTASHPHRSFAYYFNVSNVYSKHSLPWSPKPSKHSCERVQWMAISPDCGWRTTDEISKGLKCGIERRTRLGADSKR